MVAEPEQPDAQTEAEDFFRAEYHGLHALAGYLGATNQEAHDAVMTAMSDLIRRWSEVDSPRAYARLCVMHAFIQGRQRERRRLERLIERRAVSDSTSADDVGLADWEGRQWVLQKLRALPPRQREVLALVVDGMSPAEAALVLGRSGAAVRQSLLEARLRLSKELREEGLIPPRTSFESTMRKEAP